MFLPNKGQTVKITNEHFSTMATMVAPLDTPEKRAQYRAQNLTDKRYRWDLAYAAGCTRFICDALYAYLDDTHIDTALRAIVKPL
jgi:hypothetical protein